MRITRNADIEGVVTIATDTVRPRVVMFGGVHGDEVSGVHAIEKLFFDFFAGRRILARGSLTLARANEEALAREVRYVRYNLNRLFLETYGSDIDRASYEVSRAEELKTLLRDCDYFLDFHSAPIAREPFLIAEKRNVGFYGRLGVPKMITGWSKFSSGVIGGDAENYANKHGATAATLESGSHFDKQSNDIAYASSLAMLSRLDMIEHVDREADASAEVFDMYKVVTKGADDFRYVEPVQNFQLLRTNAPFAFQGNAPLIVHEDSYLLIPMRPEKTKLGEEICYLGRKLADG